MLAFAKVCLHLQKCDCICKSVLAFAKRGFIFFLFVFFVWKNHEQNLTKVNYSDTYFSADFVTAIYRRRLKSTGVRFRPVDTEVKFSAGYISGL